MAGFSQGGGVGLALARWMIDGDPGFDVWGMDVSRFGDWATLAYTNAKVRENYSRRFSIRFPNEELPAARPLRTTPIYDKLLDSRAQMGAVYGLEQPLWFAPPGVEEQFSWRRSTDFKPVGMESHAVRESVGLMEISGFAKYTISGDEARAWLDRVLACNIPRQGRMTLAPMLNHGGKLIGDFTLASLDDERYFVAGSGTAEEYHMRWFESLKTPGSDVDIHPHGPDMVGLSIAGPRSRDLLQSLTDEDVSAEAFRFMGIRKMDLGMAPCLVGRVSYTGDLGYELWMRPAYQRYVFDLFMDEGKRYDIGLFGSRALNSLRLEKSYGSWAREYRPIYSPIEAGLERFVAHSKEAEFVGKQAVANEREGGGKLRLRTFVVDADDADAIGDEPIWFDGEVRGWVTSGGYAHCSKVSVAMGYVPKDIADLPDSWEIEILGERRRARLQPDPLFDPHATRMRG